MSRFNSDDESRESRLEKYFNEQERDRLISKGYRLPTIGDHNLAVGILQETYNKLEKEFCKAVIYAYKSQEPVNVGMLKNLRRLADKYSINCFKIY